MASKTAVVGSTVGLHARPASLLAAAVEDSGVEMTIGRDGEEAVDAASLLEVMSLGIEYGETVTITAAGEGAEAALEEIAKLIEANLDE